MKYATFKVLVNWKNINNKSGLYLVYLRITIDRKSKFVRIPNLQKVDLRDFKKQFIGILPKPNCECCKIIF